MKRVDFNTEDFTNTQYGAMRTLIAIGSVAVIRGGCEIGKIIITKIRERKLSKSEG